MSVTSTAATKQYVRIAAALKKADIYTERNEFVADPATGAPVGWKLTVKPGPDGVLNEDPATQSSPAVQERSSARSALKGTDVSVFETALATVGPLVKIDAVLKAVADQLGIKPVEQATVGHNGGITGGMAGFKNGVPVP